MATTEETFSPYRLAHLIDAGLKNGTCDGAEWLKNVALNWVMFDRPEAIEYATDDAEAISQSADSAVPIYTGHRWQVFTDLMAWQFSEEIAKEFGALPSDMTEAVGVVLCVLAERLIYALEAERDEDENEDEEQ